MKNIKKIFGLIFIISILFAACSKKPHIREVGHRGNASSVKREKINLENAAFKDLGLPLPENNYGRKVPYLIPVNENFDENFSIFKKYDENKALAFFKNRNITGYGDNSSYWRWKTSIKKSEWYDNVRKKVSALSKSSYKNVFVLQGNKWVHKKMGYLSPVKNIKIIGRGPSGIVTHILVETTSNKYLITKEWNVRKIFATHHNLYGARAKQKYNMKRPIVRNVSSLPSANLAFEDDGKYIHVYGGGFGHGVGMCQYGVPDLVKDGYKYDEILKRYYTSAKLKTIEEVLGYNKKIRVGITSHGTSLSHRTVKVFADSKLRIFNNDFDITLGENEKVKVVNSWGKVCVIIPNGKKFYSKQPVNFKSYNEFVIVGPIRKSHTSYPKYRDTIIISPYGKNLKIIAELDIEKYLMQVVPSEMPISFGLESLKVQAVAARTYALSDYLKARYEKEGFHVKDTVESQVFNNQVESSLANRAIRETEGQIMSYDNKPIDAKYFSTSCGFTNFANDVW